MTVTLPSKKSMAAASDPEPVETKKKSATMRLSGSSSSSLLGHSDDNSINSSINRSMTLTVGGNNELLSMTSKRWKNRAFGSFHERASPNIIFKENRGVALRKHPGDSNGFVFTQEPIRVEEKFIVRLLELNKNYHVSLVSHNIYKSVYSYVFIYLGYWIDYTESINTRYTKEFCVSQSSPRLLGCH